MWPEYGGRGITVCERWRPRYSFPLFLTDMGPRPSPEHSLDRINNNGPYSPENCRWATHTQQMRNRRNNVIVEIAGEQLSLGDACERFGQEIERVRKRLKAGWDIKRALTAQSHEKKFFMLNGERVAKKLAAAQAGIPLYVLHYRLKSGWPVEKALSTPVDLRYSSRAKSLEY